MHSCKQIYRISLAGRGPQGSLKSNSLFLFLPLSEPPVHLRPNLHPPEEMFGCPQHTPVPFPHSYFCCSPRNPGTGLERMQVLHCQLQPRNSHSGIMSLHYSTEQPNSAGMKSGINDHWLAQKLSQAKAGSKAHLNASPASSSGHQQLMAALHPCLLAVCEAGLGTGFTLTHLFHLTPLKTEIYTELKKVLQKEKPNQTKPWWETNYCTHEPLEGWNNRNFLISLNNGKHSV